MFRNREIRQFSAAFLCISIASVMLSFPIASEAGWISLASAVAFGSLFLVFTWARYQKIAELSEQIDLVLHNAELIYMNEAEEGELSILQSEIIKMTLRIREQNDTLKREKEHLADALADIAHQIRTPLTSAHLILSLLEKNPEEKERRALLREAAELFVQIEWLIDSLLKLSRLDAGIVELQNKPVDVNSLLQTAVRPLLIPMELHHIELQTEVPDGMTIEGDFSWLSEAVQNIVKNCMQSVGDYGRIRIMCKNTLLYDEIMIHDSGSGFDKEDLPHLFERFYRGKNESATGYGIGLAICKTIIARHGGTISAKNHPQGGAVFCIHFLK